MIRNVLCPRGHIHALRLYDCPTCESAHARRCDPVTMSESPPVASSDQQEPR